MIHLLAKPINLEYLCNEIGLQYKGDAKTSISKICPLDKLAENSLSFSNKKIDLISVDGVVIAPLGTEGKNIINSDNPRRDFIKVLNFLLDKSLLSYKSHPPKIHPSVKVGQNVVIEESVIIGEGTVIEHNAVIKENTRIGNNCFIGCGVVIGHTGFGFERLNDGTPLRVPHIGGVIIGDNVEIEANTCIAKGMIGNTTVEDNCMVDTLAYIPHNCIIGKNAMITSFSSIGGSVTIGENCTILSSNIKNKIKVGDNAFIGIGSVVVRNVKPDSVVFGNPAKKIK